MSEELPPPFDPANLPPLPPPGKKPLSKLACAGIGLGILLASSALCFVSPFFFYVGLIGAFVSLFFEGWRYIFVGYALSALAIVGIGLLVLIIACSNSHSSL